MACPRSRRPELGSARDGAALQVGPGQRLLEQVRSPRSTRLLSASCSPLYCSVLSAWSDQRYGGSSSSGTRLATARATRRPGASRRPSAVPPMGPAGGVPGRGDVAGGLHVGQVRATVAVDVDRAGGQVHRCVEQSRDVRARPHSDDDQVGGQPLAAAELDPADRRAGGVGREGGDALVGEGCGRRAARARCAPPLTARWPSGPHSGPGPPSTAMNATPGPARVAADSQPMNPCRRGRRRGHRGPGVARGASASARVRNWSTPDRSMPGMRGRALHAPGAGHQRGVGAAGRRTRAGRPAARASRPVAASPSRSVMP